jgi:hypothetical protein
MKNNRIILLTRAAFCALIIAGTVAGAKAQSEERRGWGYGFAAPGGAFNSVTLQFGGGGEGVLHKGFGVGAEFSYLGPVDQFGEGFKVLSTNSSYHFVASDPDQKWVPFVTGGYSAGFRNGRTENMVNFGGGVNYWFARRAGLRLEFRDHVLTNGGTHLYGLRVGFNFK